jgi:hypothetical protein
VRQCRVTIKIFMGRIVPALLLLVLGACAGLAPKVEGVRTIGIVSAIGDKFHLRTVGITVFGNESQEIAIDAWGIDDLMTAKIRAALTPRFDVRPVTYRRAAFATLENRIAIGIDQLRPEIVRAEVSPQGLDAYLVVTKGIGQYNQTNQILEGLGIVQGSDLFASNIYAHAYYEISVVDGHAWTLSRSTVAGLPGGGEGLFGPRMKGVDRELDKSWWPSSLDAASNQRLKGVVVELIDQSLPGTLQRMQLVQ